MRLEPTSQDCPVSDHRNDHISAEQYDTILSSRTNSAEYSYEYPNYYSRQYKYEIVDRPNSDNHCYHEESFTDENKQDCHHVIAPESPPQNLYRSSSPLATRDNHFPIFTERSARRHPPFGNSRSAFSPTRGFLNSKANMAGSKHEIAEDDDEMMVMMRTLQRLGRFMTIQQQESQSGNFGTSEVEREPLYSGYSDLLTKMPPAEDLASSHENIDYPREPDTPVPPKVLHLPTGLLSRHWSKDSYAEVLDLQQNIERVKELLKAIENKAGEIKQEVNEAEKETIDAVHGFLTNVTEFGEKVAKDGKAKFEENEKEWQQMLDDIFTNSGLDKVVEELKKDSATTCAIVIALVAPVLLALTR
ncbi:unnamed protein product [Nippostrongylus brasiliensis]|uniref:t-SNARE coiled-coil homology domain-containing protein n=1 Tax=Nippostrongylus brasiliensis TaxID=27835 RepID=A0A158R053_NIPBR|nr:unnamed protein product [Nippostrongylus brasiliensis]